MRYEYGMRTLLRVLAILPSTTNPAASFFFDREGRNASSCLGRRSSNVTSLILGKRTKRGNCMFDDAYGRDVHSHALFNKKYSEPFARQCFTGKTGTPLKANAVSRILPGKCLTGHQQASSLKLV